jgi:tRNA threonylcarbamoyladenosine biosynthesis protein TsaE
MKLEIKDLKDIRSAAREFLHEMGDDKVFAFYGSMGAGKTTFIKALCEEMCVTETVTSPTFAIINEYRDKGGRTIYHFDFYRIHKLEEVFDFGYEDYFYSGNLCFIEWPELVESVLPENTLKITILQVENGIRIVDHL